MKKVKILFVDDDANIINGLKRMLFPMRKEWGQYFCTSGEEALKIVENENVDIIVTDMRMPKMNGVQLLEKVREKFPNVIRIILSGQADDEMALKSISVAHQFISKPCVPEELKEVIKNSSDLKSHLHDNKNIQSLVAGVDQLPVLPDIYLEIEKEFNKEERSLNKIGAIVSKNPSLTAKILKIVNSAFFGLPKNISNPIEAVNYLGLGIIKSLVLYIPLFEGVDAASNVRASMTDLLNHCLHTANYSLDLHKKLELPNNMKDDLYIASLLHDVGKLVIMKNKEVYEQIETVIKKEKLKYHDVENELLGTSHAEIGAYLLGIWGIPNKIIEVIMNHHKLEKQTDNSFDLSNLVYISNFSQYLSPQLRTELENYLYSNKDEISLKTKIGELQNG
ncbi:MAG: HDOD domain-containing protein [Melioribacteraceae bacterium]|nr:HDOD domain-containing protein [Melioribacteraceae bacterium]